MKVPREIVIVGAGLGGLRAAESLRQQGFDGRLTLLGAESEPPYDRPPLSKELLVGSRSPETIFLRSREALDALALDLRLGTTASGLDLARRHVQIGEEAVRYDALILASGAAPRRLAELDGSGEALSLRTLSDAAALRARLVDARRLVIVGAGFIGSEVASSARQLGLEVTVVELATTPLAHAFGERVGAALMRLHLQAGTTLRLGVSVTRLDAGGVELSDGSRLEADVVLVAVGAEPSLGWLAGSGLELGNGVVCDSSLNAGAEGVYAVGDLANWPNPLFGRRMRVEHWTNASEQAQHVASNLLGGSAEPFLGTNYVWSDQYGVRIQFVGSAAAEELLIVEGSLEELRFLAWYRQGDRLVGALGVGSARGVMRSRALIAAATSWQVALASLERDA